MTQPTANHPPAVRRYPTWNERWQVEANLIDIERRIIAPSMITIAHGKIESILRLAEDASATLPYALPGFIDAHIHVESSMLVPSEFARLATVHGTVATVSDPHEIANVLGVDGVHFMLENAFKVPLKFCFGAPSCVPATAFETAGATIDAAAIERLMHRPDIGYLAEMMNFPGVLADDPEVLSKIASAKKFSKPVDGHAPGLTGDLMRRYVAAGISTDHECTTLEEALQKLNAGMQILIREGSAAKNYEALKSLIATHPDRVLFCSDDKHPDELADGHINRIVQRSLIEGFDLFDVLRIACLNPIDHYRLPVGRLRVGDPADFLLAPDLSFSSVHQTVIDGQVVAEDGFSLIASQTCLPLNQFNCQPKRPSDFTLHTECNSPSCQVQVIGAFAGSLVTQRLIETAVVKDGELQLDVPRDLLKIAVVNRYHNAPPAVALVHGFGLKQGAIASSVAHDSHNLIAVGVDDESICDAVNEIVAAQGGVTAVANGSRLTLPLPVAGIMSHADGYQVANQYKAVDRFAKEQLGSILASPFMTLSFMALLVIPELKLSDMGLFDVRQFAFTNLEL